MSSRREFVSGASASLCATLALGAMPSRRTEVSIRGDAFLINGKPTYPGRRWNGHKIEGLLFNSRMVQGIFDDLNPETRAQWAYPDTGKWDPERNAREFVAAMPEWRRHGLLAFTINLQGGSPQGYSRDQPWHNSAITAVGTLRPDYMKRLERILDRADQLGMVVILGIFYFGQDQRLKDEAAVIRALDAAVDWVQDRGYRNVLIEVNNECNVRYDHAILQPARVHELILRVKSRVQNGRRLFVSTSYGGGTIPGENVVRASDYLLLHGNGVGEPDRIADMVRRTRGVPGYRPMPILFNEDDHFDFDRPRNNMIAAVEEYASWGYFDFRQRDERFEEGYQSVPVDWGIRSSRKRAFFAKVREITTDGKPANPKEVWPGAEWDMVAPEGAGLSRSRLDALRDLVGGRGCVIRGGRMVYQWGDIGRPSDVASACKPVISALLLLAIQEGKLKSVDASVADVEPRLRTLNAGKDAGITWLHLASQTSGYGLAELPGAAWAYNDFALALYYQTLTGKVFGEDGTRLFRSRFALPLGFQDEARFDTLGADRPGRLAVSPRDFARFGLLWMRNGRWKDRQIVRPDLVKLSLSGIVPAGLPRTSGREAPMLPGQRSIGGTRDQTATGPGFYTFNWWVNAKDREGSRPFAALPSDAFAAMGHGGMRALIVVRSWDLIVCWNDSPIDDMDASAGNSDTRCNQAMQLIRDSLS